MTSCLHVMAIKGYIQMAAAESPHPVQQLAEDAAGGPHVDGGGVAASRHDHLGRPVAGRRHHARQRRRQPARPGAGVAACKQRQAAAWVPVVTHTEAMQPASVAPSTNLCWATRQLLAICDC